MKPMIHEIMAAGPAIEDASHAPNNQPEPINEPCPSKTSCERLILPVSYTHLTLPTNFSV